MTSVRMMVSQRQPSDCADGLSLATAGQRQPYGCADTTDPLHRIQKPANQTRIGRSGLVRMSTDRLFRSRRQPVGCTDRRNWTTESQRQPGGCAGVVDWLVTARWSPIRPTTGRFRWRRSGSVRMTADRSLVVQRRPDGRAGCAERPELGP